VHKRQSEADPSVITGIRNESRWRQFFNMI